MVPRGILGIAIAALVAAIVAVESQSTTDAAAQDKPSRYCTKYASVSTGSDRNPGTWELPFRTAQRLANKLRGREVGCLRAGTYTAADGLPYVMDIVKANITIRSAPRERAHILGVIRVQPPARNVRISRVSVEGTGGQNTVKVYADDFVLDRSDITNRWRGSSCLILGSNAFDGAAERPLVRLNRFHECGQRGNKFDHAIYAANVSDGRILDNVFWGVAGYTIILFPNAQRTLFAHNVIDGSQPSLRGGVSIGGDQSYTSNDNVVESNVIAYARTFNITSSWNRSTGEGNVARANCVWGGAHGNIGRANGFVAIDNVFANPEFVDRERGDLRLGSASVCVSVVGYDTAAKVVGN